MNFNFHSSFKKIGEIDSYVDSETIHDEPMLFSASEMFAWSAGGPLTIMFMNAMRKQLVDMEMYCHDTNQHVVIDTRSHMLMPGFRPAIGGWHCDAYPRKNGSQPDLHAESVKNNYHIVCFVSDNRLGVSRTEFVDDEYILPIDNIATDRVWHSVDSSVPKSTPIYTQKDGEILKFSQSTLHRATPCVNPGWRWWIRVSCYYNPPKNKIRKQVQVYGPENQSW